ncbi:MAG: type II toxin-antitoxin system RelE/ParE family toxin [Theionarchaea archaeon]|nr:type II toxin-antitoxin system RelE/ParE family toxin [Theionarchaea archaeon]
MWDTFLIQNLSYRFRIGDCRVIFDIDGKTLVILRIGHRKRIYRR